MAELVNVIVGGDPFCSEALRSSIDQDEFERARSLILGALRDGQIQALGYVGEGPRRVGVASRTRDASASDEKLPSFPYQASRAERIPAHFWEFASVSWLTSHAESMTEEIAGIHFLVQEVEPYWPLNDTQPDDDAQPGYASIRLEIPASDRIVTLDHNSAPLKAAIEAVGEVIEGLKRAPNDLGTITAEDRTVILSSLEHGRKLLSAPQVSLSAFLVFLKSPLGFIATAASAGVVGEAAVNALKFLSSLFGAG